MIKINKQEIIFELTDRIEYGLKSKLKLVSGSRNINTSVYSTSRLYPSLDMLSFYISKNRKEGLKCKTDVFEELSNIKNNWHQEQIEEAKRRNSNQLPDFNSAYIEDKLDGLEDKFIFSSQIFYYLKLDKNTGLLSLRKDLVISANSDSIWYDSTRVKEVFTERKLIGETIQFEGNSLKLDGDILSTIICPEELNSNKELVSKTSKYLLSGLLEDNSDRINMSWENYIKDTGYQTSQFVSACANHSEEIF